MVRCLMGIEVHNDTEVHISSYQEIYVLEREWEQYKSFEKWELYNRIAIQPEDDYMIEIYITKGSKILYSESWCS